MMCSQNNDCGTLECQHYGCVSERLGFSTETSSLPESTVEPEIIVNSSAEAYQGLVGVCLLEN